MGIVSDTFDQENSKELFAFDELIFGRKIRLFTDSSHRLIAASFAPGESKGHAFLVVDYDGKKIGRSGFLGENCCK